MAVHARKENFHIDPLEAKRREITSYVINSMRLEGVTLNEAMLRNFEAYNRGEVDEAEFLKRGLEIAMSIEKSSK